MPEIDIVPTHDSYVFEASVGQNFGSSTEMKFARWNGGDEYGFMKWDLSSIPVGSTIDTAVIYLYVFTANSQFTNHNCFLCDTDWDESTITWNNQPGQTGGSLWEWSGASVGWKNSGALGATFANWFTGAVNNYGIKIYDTGADAAGHVHVNSSENASLKPYAKINYTPPAKVGGFSGFSPWIFMKGAWEKHNKIWKPNKKILIPQGI